MLEVNVVLTMDGVMVQYGWITCIVVDLKALCSVVPGHIQLE